jgi:hypothetical protein
MMPIRMSDPIILSLLFEVSPQQAAEYHSVDLHNPNRNRSNIKLLHKKPCHLGSYLNGLSASDSDSDFDKLIYSQQAAGNKTLKEI